MKFRGVSNHKDGGQVAGAAAAVAGHRRPVEKGKPTQRWAIPVLRLT